MRYVMALVLAVLAFAAIPATPAAACDACVRGGKKEPTQVECFLDVDGGGEICTSGGGYCNEEGECDETETVAIAGDGSRWAESLQSTPARFASSSVADFTAEALDGGEGAGPTLLVRRACDGAVVARQYASQDADRMRRDANTLTI